MEMLSSDSLKEVKSVFRACNLASTGSKLDIIYIFEDM